MGAVSADLPVADIDIQFHQSERVLISGGGKCSPTVPREVAEKCRLVIGSIDSLDPDYESVMLWRSGMEMAEYVFAGGAKKLTFEGVTAYGQAESLTAYKYRVWLVEYPSRTGVEQSNIRPLADECSASVDAESERGLPVVHSDGTRLVVVEPWIAEIEDPDGGDQMPSGVLSEAALEFVADEVLELADG
ncbi:hypothetical protein ACIA03_02945 [Nocardioides sp. NPDC051685]|uniref:hypothetical protein n=1 Tax=Nocardioides sp. NPDC051685 TaxID=3364334 RepID=UPI003792785D